MAIMIPQKPNEFDAASMEGLMYEALEQLPDDYYVLHSMKIAALQKNEGYRENEGDFVIFHPMKGIICLEAKAGKVSCDNGSWYYQSGTPMAHGGPFRQAENFKWKLVEYIDNMNKSILLHKCKVLHAVWFPSISKSELEKVILPSECLIQQIMTKEALINPQNEIDEIFNIKIKISGKFIETSLNSSDTKAMLKDILCPAFEIFPSASFDDDIKKIIFHHLLNEQINVLNFLIEQRTAVINGAAGTGKTMIALEKARRNAEKGERVLFLCYNNQLKKYIAKNYTNDDIDYYTIDGFACKICNTEDPNYYNLSERLLEMMDDNAFPYEHIVVDEGQDFGIEAIELSDVMDLLKEIVTGNKDRKGSFYVFYDDLQLVQAKKIPSFIKDADCKLTLYRNCRNTINIAKTSLRPITTRQPELIEGCVSGAPAVIHFCKNETLIDEIDRTIGKLQSGNMEDIVILTCQTEQRSVANKYIEDGRYKNSIRFSTCRKFKGLEADAVILIDVDRETFNSNNVLLYYVGASRARIKLDIIAELNNDECREILEKEFKVDTIIKKPMKDFASALNAVGKVK